MSKLVPNNRLRSVPVELVVGRVLRHSREHTFSSRLRTEHGDEVVVEASVTQAPGRNLVVEVRPAEISSPDVTVLFARNVRELLLIADYL
jgi:hypothetical protein